MTAPQYNRFPTYKEPVTTKGGNTSNSWYTFWSGLFQGNPTGPVSALLPVSSPFTYVAPVAGVVFLSAGTTTGVQISRDNANFYPTGATSGAFPLSQGDVLVVSYSMAPPTATFFPR